MQEKMCTEPKRMNISFKSLIREGLISSRSERVLLENSFQLGPIAHQTCDFEANIKDIITNTRGRRLIVIQNWSLATYLNNFTTLRSLPSLKTRNVFTTRIDLASCVCDKNSWRISIKPAETIDAASALRRHLNWGFSALCLILVAWLENKEPRLIFSQSIWGKNSGLLYVRTALIFSR